MAKIKTEQEKTEARPARQAAAKARRAQKEQEVLDRRADQLRRAVEQLEALDDEVRTAREHKARHHALSDHLRGFYDEVDKLAKGKSLMEATTLIVEQINDVIRDAKSIISNDPYLDRVKEFVPAGDNPVYPDVLMVTRSVRQCLGRTEKGFGEREKRVIKARRQARTIVAALKHFVEQHEHPSKEAVEERLEASAPDDWFFQDDNGDFYFDFEHLDDVDAGGGLGRSDQRADDEDG